MTRTGVLVFSIAAGLVVVGGAGTAIALAATAPPDVAPIVVVAEPDAEATPVQTVEAAEPVEPVDATTASLLFMIEEEKLAHDVYVTLGDL